MSARLAALGKIVDWIEGIDVEAIKSKYGHKETPVATATDRPDDEEEKAYLKLAEESERG